MWLSSTTLLIGFIASCSAWNFLQITKPAPYTLHVKNIQIQKCGSRSRLIELKDINVTQVKNTYEMSAKFQAKTHINKPLKAEYRYQRKGRSFYMLPILGTIQDVCALDVLAAQQCTAKVNNQKVPCKCPIEKNACEHGDEPLGSIKGREFLD